MFAPLYMLHEFDEYVLPGGFVGFMNENIYKAAPDEGPVDWNAVFGINMFTWAAFVVYGLWGISDPSQAGWMPYFVIGQALVHLFLGIIGKRLINPGMTTAWLLHVPWALWTISLMMGAGRSGTRTGTTMPSRAWRSTRPCP